VGIMVSVSLYVRVADHLNKTSLFLATIIKE
jgi:hypothetical protein